MVRGLGIGRQQAVIRRRVLHALQQGALRQIGRHGFHGGADKGFVELFAAQITGQAAASDKFDFGYAAVQRVHAHIIARVVAVQPALGGDNQAVIAACARLPGGHDAVGAGKFVEMAVYG